MKIFDEKKPGVYFIRYFALMFLSWLIIIGGLSNL